MNQDLLNSAFHLHQSGRIQEALDLYNKVLPSQQGNAQLLYLAGTANLQLGWREQGIELLQRSLILNPNNPVAHNNIGRALQSLRRPDEAMASFDAALALKPDYAEAHFNRASVLQERKRLDEALASYDAALAINPAFVEALDGRGNALRDLNRMDEALASFDTALAVNRKHAGVHCNRGMVLRELGRREEALASYDAALALNPDFAEAHNNRGVVLQDLMRLDEALASFDKAIKARRDYAKAYCNKAYVLLLKGDYDKGWALLEWRFKGEQVKPRFPEPPWLGKEKLEGKSILLHAEEGLGDTIQFCRYAKSVSDLGAKVYLEVQKPLVNLLQGLEGATEVVERGQLRSAFDYHCPLLSLPLSLKTTLTSIPSPGPYLRADETKQRAWQERIGATPRLKVGLAWSGGLRPGRPEWRSVNEGRNIPLELLCRTLNTLDADFFTLQKGEQAEAEIRARQQELWPGGNFYNFMDEDKDFSDTAAIIANLDVVVSVCTSIAHLSAALGKPTWIPLKFDNDWRWLTERGDSPWYRSVKLYRQAEDRRWQPVLQRVAEDLGKMAEVSRR